MGIIEKIEDLHVWSRTLNLEHLSTFKKQWIENRLDTIIEMLVAYSEGRN